MPDPVASAPDVLPWNPARPYAERSTDWNQGCPTGYFAQFTEGAAPGAMLLPNGVEGIRCRRLASSDVFTVQGESLSWEDTLANVNAALVEGEFRVSWVWWLVLGSIAMGVLSRLTTGNKKRPQEAR